MSYNSSEGAVRLLEKNQNKINWFALSFNSSEDLQFVENNLDKIYWQYLSQNISQRAIRLLEKYPNEIKKNQDKINWRFLYGNPNIFKYDYNKMKLNCMLFKEELIKNRFHPRNLSKFKDWKINGF